MSESILFITGHLAYQNLCRELESMGSTDFVCRVENIGVKVAALMTTNIISRRLSNVDGIDKIILPGLFAGDVNELSNTFGVPFMRGPNDLRDLTEYFGGASVPPDLSEYEIQIFAEIVDAPHLSVGEIVERALLYRSDGANVIDLGCLPDTPFPHLTDSINALKEAEFAVSVDSLDSQFLLEAGKAGADYLLSLNESTLWIAEQVQSIPVLIPEQAHDVESLYRCIDQLSNLDRKFLADPILEPFPFGFTTSIVRYHALRARYPDCSILMGTGNITELMDADTSGMTFLLLSILTELKINALLTTEVSNHACRAVREADLARRILYAAIQDQRLPRRYNSGLMSIHDKKPFPYTADEIIKTASEIRDPSYRIQVSEDGIHLFNRDGIHCAQDPFELQQFIDVNNDGSHMFYLGVELGRAQIAWQLGKRYLQDNELEWGVARRDLPAAFESGSGDGGDDANQTTADLVPKQNDES